MILTSKARYAVTAIIELASSKDNKPLALSLIAKKQNISLFYLEQIFSKLKKSALVEAIKGPGGGYILLKNPSEISIATIIKAIGEPVKMTHCNSSSKACNSLTSKTKCKTHNLWQGLENIIYQYLDSITLKDI
jgi:Rrf2 family iron-sulfur cluster assembly transcriptional regulator